MKKQLHIGIQRNLIITLVLSGLLIISLQWSLRLYTKKSIEESSSAYDIHFKKLIDNSTISLSPFDPNSATTEQWIALGFTQKQVATILKYKGIVGGTFSSKEQLKKCYAISEEKYRQLEPFILLDEKTSKGKSNASFSKKLLISAKFQPDHLSAEEWQKMGFSEKQAAAIIKYKNYLGGSFVSQEKLKECFIINDDHFQQLQPWLILPKKTPADFKNFNRSSFGKSKIDYKKFDPNLYQKNDWKAIGFSDKQAEVLINYRDKNLRGSFQNLEDLKSCFVISEEKFNEMKAYIVLDPENFKQKTPSLSNKQNQQTDYSTIDLNKISYKQLIEFGFDERAAGSFVGFRKKLGGFVNEQQMLDTYNIDKDLMQKLTSICKFSNEDVTKHSLVDAPEDWLKNHPYFKYSSDKIIFYRISYPNDEKIWKLLKLKPEYETRMRWYIK